MDEWESCGKISTLVLKLYENARAVKKYLFIFLIFIFANSLFCYNTKAQTVELLAGNTLNGAMNGVVLGGATMALQNSNEFGPARVGLGAGTLYGIGVGVHDIVKTQVGQQFYVSGTFNDATNTSVLVLLDTVYGAAGGVVIASSISLILQEPLGTAVQYGAGTGAWIGFGFGLVDAFVLAEGPDFSQAASFSHQKDVSGLITYRSDDESVQVGILNPELTRQKMISRNSVNSYYRPSMQVVKLKIDL